MAKKVKQYVRCYDPDGAKTLSRHKVDSALVAIWDEHGRRLSGTFVADPNYGTSRNESAINFLRREIYVLGTTLLRKPPATWSVGDLANKVRGRPTTRPEAQGLFHALLLGTFADDHVIGRQQRSTIVKELEYAHRHSIPANLLAGFLLQSRPTERNKHHPSIPRASIMKKQREGYVEPGFEHRDD